MHPRWFRAARCVAIGLVIIRLLDFSLIPSEVPRSMGNVLPEIVAHILWVTPWLWPRSGWIWWPSFLISVALSYELVYKVVAVWMGLVTGPGVPFSQWTFSLQYMVVIAHLLALFGMWQTAALAVYRVRGPTAKRESRKTTK
jgi:hypothetical protein